MSKPVATTGDGVRRLEASSRGALAELYEAHAQPATSLAYMLTGDREVARDLAQEAFIRLAGRFQHLRDPGAFGAYLRRTIINLARSHYRRKRLEQARLQMAALQEPQGGTQYLPDLEDRDELWQALVTLPYRQRAALVLRYFEELTERETAEFLRCSVRAVNSLVARGIRRLRRQLEGGRP